MIPLVIAMAGLPGCGKSTLAAQLAPLLQAAVLDKDRVRAALFPPEEIEYSLEQDDFVFELIYQAAARLLSKGRVVILDGRTFTRAAHRRRLEAFAAVNGARLVWIECTCPPELARARLDQDRAAGVHPAENRGSALYAEVKAAADPILTPHLVVDTTLPAAACLQACLDWIYKGE